MKKHRIRRISDKRAIEIKQRNKLRYQLWLEQGKKCAKCGRALKYSESELSHKVSLAKLGKTTKENCEVLCAWWFAGCHANDEHNRGNIYNEQPQWSRENGS